MKSIKFGLIIFTTLCLFILSACFSPWAGDEGIVTFNFGGSARTFVNLNNGEFGNFSYEITFKSPGRADIVRTLPSGGKGSVTVLPGVYTITAKAFDNAGLRAYGGAIHINEWNEDYDREHEDTESFIKVEIVAGKNTNVNIEMWSAVEVGSWAELKSALELESPAGVGILDRWLFVFLKNSFSTVNSDSGIIARGNKILAADNDVTINGSVFGSDPMFTVMSNASTGLIYHLWFGVDWGMTGSITITGRQNALNPIVEVNGGSFYMTDGVTLKDNKRLTGEGGAVVVTNEGHFLMDGGTIIGNSAVNGGGVKVDSGFFEMFGGTITGNTVSYNGGGVSFYSGSNIGYFNMLGGTITGNTAGHDGGGISVVGFNLYLNSGNITGNNAANGGGVSLLGGFLIMDGGVISGNNATSNGGGFYIDNSATLNIRNGIVYGSNSNQGNIAQNGAALWVENGNAYNNIETPENFVDNPPNGVNDTIHILNDSRIQ
ncbi:MAG: hypothetical protein FWD24_00235 [Treponema sp.]|nr:hypothetical protein [Treponema sp.]